MFNMSAEKSQRSCDKGGLLNFFIMKNLIKYFIEHRVEAIKDVAMCLSVFATCVILLLLSAILQGCTTQHQAESQGKTTIITNDTTYIYHGGSVKFPKSKFNN